MTRRRGDVDDLIARFEEVADEERAERDAVRMLQGTFDLNDFQAQLGVLEKMGPAAIPRGASGDNEELPRIRAMISSMTDDERRHPARFIEDKRRLERVARGSGHEEREVAVLLDRFAMMRRMMRRIGVSTGLAGETPDFN